MRRLEQRKKVTHNIARLTVGLLLHSEERLASQLGAAGHADKAVDVEDLVHGGAACTLTHYILSAAGTSSCREEEGVKVEKSLRHIRTDNIRGFLLGLSDGSSALLLMNQSFWKRIKHQKPQTEDMTIYCGQ